MRRICIATLTKPPIILRIVTQCQTPRTWKLNKFKVGQKDAIII